MRPKSFEPKDIAAYLLRNNAKLVIGVLHVLYHHRDFYRGKVNLGFAAGARGRNSYAARPVETVVRLGLARERRVGAAYEYLLSPDGLAVINIIDGRRPPTA